MKKDLDTLIMAGLVRSLSSNRGSAKNFCKTVNRLYESKVSRQ